VAVAQFLYSHVVYMRATYCQ